MKKFIVFLLIIGLFFTNAYALEFDAVFSQGDSKTVKFENIDLVIKLVQATNENAVFSLNDRQIKEIELGEKRVLSEQISIKVTEIYKVNGNTYAKANFEFSSNNLDLSFLERPIQHGGAVIGSKTSVDINETSKNRFNLVIGQEKFVVDLDTTVKLLNISNSTAMLIMSNGKGKIRINLEENSLIEDLGVRIQLITISDRKATFVLLKSTEAVKEEKSQNINSTITDIEETTLSFGEKIKQWLISLFRW